MTACSRRCGTADADREVLAAGERANLFQLLEDHPKAFDAWNVDREAFDQVTDLDTVDSIEVVERHPLRGGVRFVRTFGASRISQVMRLAAGSRRLEFRTQVDWREHHRFLKVAFPVAIRSTRATYEIQHGHVERPTVANTSWDEARFEVCGHRWADLSESGYGVALLNDSKYGYDIRGHVMRLSLLRAPEYPDPDADQGEHEFSYALLPHPGPFYERVVDEAESFNLPMAIVSRADRGRRLRSGRGGRPTRGERRGGEMGRPIHRGGGAAVRGVGMAASGPRDAAPPVRGGDPNGSARTRRGRAAPRRPPAWSCRCGPSSWSRCAST